MEQKEIIEGNKLIAEFMGMRWERNPELFKRYTAPHIVTKPEHLEYHTSWDWLMPVVEKIENMAYGTAIGLARCSIDRVDNVVITTSDTKIHAVWGAVVEFIKWHNSQHLDDPKG